MPTITKKELVYRIASKTNQKKVVAKKIIQNFIDEVINELEKGNRLEFREFGVFEIKERAPRVARNPRTGAVVEVPAKKVVHFKAGRLMKERVCEALAPPQPANVGAVSGAEIRSEATSSFSTPRTYESSDEQYEAEV
jgi:integration host factor subunit beta